MPEEPTPGPLGTAMREATFPDGSRGIVLVQAGTSQADADVIAAQVSAEMPEPGAPKE